MSSVNNLPNPSEILMIMTDIKKDLELHSVEEVDTKYKKFKDRYPQLYKKIISSDDMSELFTMLKLINKVNNGDLSLDTATKTVGTTMAHKYIPEEILEDKKPTSK